MYKLFIPSIPLVSTEDVYYTFNIWDGENVTNPKISVNYTDKDLSTTSIKKDEVLFDATLSINNNKVSNIELASGIDREYTTKLMVKNYILKFISNKYLILGIVTILTILILFIILILINRHKRRKRRFLARRSYIRNKHKF